MQRYQGVRENKARERRIEMQAVVDAYNASGRAMSWYYYLEERLKFPFKARCKSRGAVSPLRIGEEVNVLAMAPKRSVNRKCWFECVGMAVASPSRSLS